MLSKKQLNYSFCAITVVLSVVIVCATVWILYERKLQKQVVSDEAQLSSLLEQADMKIKKGENLAEVIAALSKLGNKSIYGTLARYYAATLNVTQNESSSAILLYHQIAEHSNEPIVSEYSNFNSLHLQLITNKIDEEGALKSMEPLSKWKFFPGSVKLLEAAVLLSEESYDESLQLLDDIILSQNQQAQLAKTMYQYVNFMRNNSKSSQ